MRYLLDTHTLLWYLEGNPRLSTLAKEKIENIDNQIFVSIISLWEIAIKVNIGKLDLQSSYTDLLESLPTYQIQILHLTVEDTIFYLDLPTHHKDLFDRILISQMKNRNLPIVGADDIFDSYEIERVW